MTDENSKDHLAQAAWCWISATSYDDDPSVFNMGTPAHWVHLRTHDDGGSE